MTTTAAVRPQNRRRDPLADWCGWCGRPVDSGCPCIFDRDQLAQAWAAVKARHEASVKRYADHCFKGRNT